MARCARRRLAQLGVPQAGHFISPAPTFQIRVAVIAVHFAYVIEEASAGDPAAAEERLAALCPIAMLPVSPATPELAEFLLLGGGLPANARIDALHIACAASSFEFTGAARPHRAASSGMMGWATVPTKSLT